MSEHYKSVSCDFYDELENLAILGKDCDISYWNENEVKITIRDRIKNLFASGGIEWLETANGLKIRLDKLIEVDRKRPYNQC